MKSIVLFFGFLFALSAYADQTPVIKGIVQNSSGVATKDIPVELVWWCVDQFEHDVCDQRFTSTKPNDKGEFTIPAFTIPHLSTSGRLQARMEVYVGGSRALYSYVWGGKVDETPELHDAVVKLGFTKMTGAQLHFALKSGTDFKAWLKTHPVYAGVGIQMESGGLDQYFSNWLTEDGIAICSLYFSYPIRAKNRLLFNITLTNNGYKPAVDYGERTVFVDISEDAVMKVAPIIIAD
jgi:hypothetical protein